MLPCPFAILACLLLGLTVRLPCARTLLQDAASIDRNSSVGKVMTDQYAAALRRLCSVMGTYFTSHVARHLFRGALDLRLAPTEKASVHDVETDRTYLVLKKVLGVGGGRGSGLLVWWGAGLSGELRCSGMCCSVVCC